MKPNVRFSPWTTAALLICAAVLLLCASALAQTVSAGLTVKNPAGDEIGRVKDIVPDAYTGSPAYIIIATRSGNTAVPNETIYPTYQNGHFVLDDSRLESAPRVSEKQLQDDKHDARWKKEADQYWESRDRPSLE